MTRLPVVRGICERCMHYRRRSVLHGSCYESSKRAGVVHVHRTDSCEHFNAPTGLRWSFVPNENDPGYYGYWQLDFAPIVEWPDVTYSIGYLARMEDVGKWGAFVDDFAPIEVGNIRDAAKSLVARVLAEGGER